MTRRDEDGCKWGDGKADDNRRKKRRRRKKEKEIDEGEEEGPDEMRGNREREDGRRRGR